jgi:glutamate racemase
LIDSGDEAAEQVATTLDERGATSGSAGAGDLSCYVSDNPQRFREIGQRFLDQPIVSVTWISPEQFLGAADTTAASA